MEPTVMVDGVPFTLGEDRDGYVITATSQTVHIEGSPVIIRFDPPIAPTVDLGEIYRAIVAKLP